MLPRDAADAASGSITLSREAMATITLVGAPARGGAREEGGAPERRLG